MSQLTDERVIAISVFLVFLAGSLFLSMLTSPDLQDGTDDFYAWHSSLHGPGNRVAPPSPMRQGLALTADFLSAAGVLYLCGVVATASYDGVLLVAATALSPLLLKVWLAERLPAGPGWSFGDILARYLTPGPARLAAGVATLVVSLPLIAAQLIPIGQITAALMGLPEDQGEMAGIALVGVLILSCAAIGGVRGSTLLQIVKTAVLVLIGPLLAVSVLVSFDWDYGAVLARAAEGSGTGGGFLAHGHLFGTGLAGRLDTLSLAVTLLLGTAFLPHLLMRLSTSRTAETARRAGSWAVSTICVLCVAAVVVGYGIQALVGADGLRRAGPHGGDNLLLVAASLNGSDPGSPDNPGTLLTFVCCTAFLAVLASASVLLLSGSAAIVHDMGRRRNSPSGQSITHRPRQARLAMIAVGAVCITLAVLGRYAGAQFWLTVAYTEAATVVLPALAYSLLWRDFTVRGLRWCVYGGTLVALTLLALSPAVSGGPHALWPDADWNLLPLNSPGLISIPAAFLLGWTGTRLPTPLLQRSSTAEPPAEPQRAAEREDLPAGSGSAPGSATDRGSATGSASASGPGGGVGARRD
jgi:SSS family solute:Na+ symporter/cation/acetate symporter